MTGQRSTVDPSLPQQRIARLARGTIPSLSLTEATASVQAERASHASVSSVNQKYEEGVEHYRSGHFQSARILLEEALEQCQSHHLHHGASRIAGKVLSGLALTYYSLAEYGAAITCGRQSLVIARELEDTVLEHQALATLGNAYRHLQDYDKAIQYKKQALKLARTLCDRAKEMAALNNLGMIYRAKGDYQTAVSCYEQSVTIAQELEDQTIEKQICATLAMPTTRWATTLKRCATTRKF